MFEIPEFLFVFSLSLFFVSLIIRRRGRSVLPEAIMASESQTRFTAALCAGVIIESFLSASGYYYELDDSYDESDEEEVRAHLRRVAEQPPLKLDDSTEVRHLPADGRQTRVRAARR